MFFMFFFIPISYSTPICILYILWHEFCMVLSPFSNINANKPTISLPRHFGSFQFLFMFSLTEQSSLMKCHLLGRIPLRQCQSFLIINPMQNEDMSCTFMYCIPPGFLVWGCLSLRDHAVYPYDHPLHPARVAHDLHFDVTSSRALTPKSWAKPCQEPPKKKRWTKKMTGVNGYPSTLQPGSWYFLAKRSHDQICSLLDCIVFIGIARRIQHINCFPTFNNHTLMGRKLRPKAPEDFHHSWQTMKFRTRLRAASWRWAIQVLQTSDERDSLPCLNWLGPLMTLD